MRLVIGLHGKKRVGKDTTADILVEEHGFVKVSFADSLKRMLDVLDIPHEYKEDKNKPISWLGGKTYTELCQTLGTEWGRNTVKPSLWEDILCSKIQGSLADKNVVVSDIRYESEADRLSVEVGAWIVRVDGPRGIVVNAHTSETPLPDKYIDEVILNNGSLSELRKGVKRLVASLTIPLTLK